MKKWFRSCYFRNDRVCREDMNFFWENKMPKNLKEVNFDSFLRLQIHNRQKLLDAAVLKHYKPPGTHWKAFFASVVFNLTVRPLFFHISLVEILGDRIPL